jgi:formate-nitrite transporter family protein
LIPSKPLALVEELELTKISTPTAKANEKQPRSTQRSKQITEREADDIEEMSSPRTPVIYEVVRRLGDEEMDRPIVSLWWSGVAAGLSISFSLLAEAVLRSHLP